jgi:hypothetical protein
VTVNLSAECRDRTARFDKIVYERL